MRVSESGRLLVLIPLIAACGRASDDSAVKWVDPASVTFDYGAAADAGSSQAVVGVARLVQAAAAATTDPAQASIEYPRALEILRSARHLADETFDGMVAPGPEPLPSAFSSCFVVHDTELRWDACRLAEREPDGDAVTGYSGRLSRGASRLTWDVTKTFDETTTSYTGQAVSHWTGDLVITPARVVGTLRCDLIADVYSRVAVTYAVDLDLSLDADRCPASGTLEVKELWVEKGTTTDWPDEGALYTWSACGRVTASLATR